MKNETPRTDALFAQFGPQLHPATMAYFSLCRELEREMNEERARLRYLSELWRVTASDRDHIAKWMRVGDHNAMCRAIDHALALEAAKTE